MTFSFNVKKALPLKAVGFLFVIASTFFTALSLAKTLPDLPEPVANNAVAQVNVANRTYLLSFMGLGKNKTHKDVHNRAWQLVIEGESTGHWQAIPPVPSSLSLKGRLASVAVGVNDNAYIFGGYTVDQSHNEISTPDVYRYHPQSQQYTKLANMPVPVDDAVALVYKNRYIYIISGWHNDGNVNLTQLYDIQTGRWSQASPYLGAAVFGHAGGIVGNVMLICDGVKVVPKRDKRRTFAQQRACFKGIINANEPSRIDWRLVPHPAAQGRYRMAAAGDAANNEIVFVGGATNPYNYNGIGYNGIPAEPAPTIWTYRITNDEWTSSITKYKTMDHRSLIILDDAWVTIGGMTSNQTVTNQVLVHNL